MFVLYRAKASLSLNQKPIFLLLFSAILCTQAAAQTSLYGQSELDIFKPIINDENRCTLVSDIIGITVKKAPLRASDPKSNLSKLLECNEKAGLFDPKDGTALSSNEDVNKFCECNRELMEEGTSVSCSWYANIDDKGKKRFRPLSKEEAVDLDEQINRENCIAILTFESRKILPDGTKLSGGSHSEALIDVSITDKAFELYTVNPDTLNPPKAGSPTFTGDFGSSTLDVLRTGSGIIYEKKLVDVLIKCWEKKDKTPQDQATSGTQTTP